MAAAYLKPGCLAGAGQQDDRCLALVQRHGDTTELGPALNGGGSGIGLVAGVGEVSPAPKSLASGRVLCTGHFYAHALQPCPWAVTLQSPLISRPGKPSRRRPWPQSTDTVVPGRPWSLRAS